MFNFSSAVAIHAIRIHFNRYNTRSEQNRLKSTMWKLSKQRRNNSRWYACEGVVWGMLYADDAGMVSKSNEELKLMMRVIVSVLEVTHALLTSKRRPRQCFFRHRTRRPSPHHSTYLEATGQRYDGPVLTPRRSFH